MRRTATAFELTARQREVLRLIARGHTNTEIAEQLGITRDGAKWHVSELMNKLGVDSREDLAAYWERERSLRTRLGRFTGGILGAFALKPLTTAAAVGVVGLTGATFAAVAIAAGGTSRELDLAPVDDVGPTEQASTIADTTPATGTIPGESPRWNQYIVNAGDTCETIALEFGTTVEQLLAANAKLDASCSLHPGMTLRIVPGSAAQQITGIPGPRIPQATTIPQALTTYVVQPGDSCSSIAATHGIRLGELLAWNSAMEEGCTNLAVGQELVISGGPPVATTPAPSIQDRSNGHIVGVSPAESAVVTQADTRSPEPQRPGGICAEVSFANARGNLQAFQMELNGHDVTSQLSWVVDPDDLTGGRMCFGPQEGIEPGNHLVTIIVANAVNGFDIFRWEFKVAP